LFTNKYTRDRNDLGLSFTSHTAAEQSLTRDISFSRNFTMMFDARKLEDGGANRWFKRLTIATLAQVTGVKYYLYVLRTDETLESCAAC